MKPVYTVPTCKSCHNCPVDGESKVITAPAFPESLTKKVLRSDVFWAGVVVLVATLVRTWNLTEHDFGNLYYAAAVRSMSANWHNFLFAAFDPGGFLMLDKPPVAFWLQVVSVKLLGYHGLALHLPQAIAGVGSSALVYWLTRRVFDTRAAFVAGIVMALTPAAVAVDRSNLPDSLLLLLLLLAALAVVRSAETGRWRGLLLGMALVGVAFNVKMIVAFIVLPTFWLVHLAGKWAAWQHRSLQLTVAAVLTAVIACSWPLYVDLTPPDRRPYVGDTANNSVLTLAFGMFGFGRVAGLTQPPPGDAGPPPDTRADRREPLPAPRREHGPALTAQGGHPGPFRLANRDMAGHITWLIPAAFGGVVALWGRRCALAPRQRLAVLLWAGWFLSYAGAFSFSNSPAHPYYLALLGPPVGFFVGGGVSMLLDRLGKQDRPADYTALAVLAVTAIAQYLVLGYVPSWRTWVAPAMLALVAGGCVLVLLGAGHGAHASTKARAGLMLGLLGLLVAPTAWSLTPALAPGGRMVPIADPVLLSDASDDDGGARNLALVQGMCDWLRTKSDSAEYLLAGADIHLLAPFVIEAGAPVLPYGGFSGTDPILTAEEFAELVAVGRVRYALVVDGPRMGHMGPAAGDPVADWIRAHGKRCSREEWALPAEPDSHAAPWGDTEGLVRRLFTDDNINLYALSSRP